MPQPLLQIERVSKAFGKTLAVDDVSLEIAGGEFFALLGPSGCGKTSLMRLIAGFESPDAGRIFIDGRDVSADPPHKRAVNMMFQSYALFPHMNVAANIGYALKRRGLSAGMIGQRVRDMLALVRMEGFEERRPDSLSGGQKARVALARALAGEPKLLLLDEPLSALDRKLREEIQFELMQVQRDLGVSFLIVTHDQDEAMAMASRIAVMRDGGLAQIAAPRRLYEKPASRWVARFIGDANVLDACVRESVASQIQLEIDGALHLVVDGADEAFHPGASVAICVRPERMNLHAERPLTGNVLAGEIVEIVYLGASISWRIRCDNGAVVRVITSSGIDGSFERGARAFISYAPDAARVLCR